MQWERLPCKLRIHGGLLRGTRRDGPQRRELKRRLKLAGIQRLLASYGPTGVALLPICRELEIALVVHCHGYDAHNKRVVAEYLDSYRQVGREAAAIGHVG